MTQDRIELFNFYYKKACKAQEGIIILDEYRPANLGFFGKLKAKKAIKLFEMALEIFPDHFQSLLFVGKIYQRLKDYEKSLKYLEAATEHEKENHMAPQEASLVAMHLNLVDKAIEYSTEALRRKPDDPALLGNHAMNLLIAGAFTKAYETIEQALTVNPKDHINQEIKSRILGVREGRLSQPTFKEVIGQ
jgi:tetratricopeptide (TPR) repeat protein